MTLFLKKSTEQCEHFRAFPICNASQTKVSVFNVYNIKCVNVLERNNYFYWLLKWALKSAKIIDKTSFCSFEHKLVPSIILVYINIVKYLFQYIVI